MKKMKALALLILASSAFASAGTPDIHLYFSITEGEHSRDSNSTTTVITINGNHLVYDQSYSGYGAGRRKPVHKEANIRNEEITRLNDLIRSKGLLYSASVERPTNGPGRYAIMTLNVLTDKKKAPIKISGMTKEIENEKLYVNVRALREQIERLLADSR